jgi:hypothetical protein
VESIFLAHHAMCERCHAAWKRRLARHSARHFLIPIFVVCFLVSVGSSSDGMPDFLMPAAATAGLGSLITYLVLGQMGSWCHPREARKILHQGVAFAGLDELGERPEPREEQRDNDEPALQPPVSGG